MTDRSELNWRTSSRSGGANCVEVALDGDRVHVRDSKDRSGPVLTFSRAAFQDFLDEITESEVDQR
jgi:hypothetical protein